MRTCLFIVCSLLISFGSFAQNNAETPAALKKQMSDIRLETNWDNPDEAKRANDSIKVLSKKLSDFYRQQNAPADETEEQKSIREGNQDYKDKLFDQILKSVSQGEGANIFLGEPVREEITEKFKDDDDPAIRSTDFLNNLSCLMINMSMKGVDKIIEQMPNFKKIKTLIITCEHPGEFVDLEKILYNAKEYPLDHLYILNFGSSLTSIPNTIGDFNDLTNLSIINNNISDLPGNISSLKKLSILQVDLNPVSTLISVISPLKNLSELSLAKTSVSSSEVAQIKLALPGCHIQTQ
jgi:hypothetical protein